jgi:peroxin-2
MRLAPPSSQVSREVSFEYLNRQLVWHAFTEFLLFLLPLVGIGRWRRWISRVWRKTITAMRANDEDEVALGQKIGQLAFLPERTCAICYQEQNPSSTSESDMLGVVASSGGIIGSAQTDVTNPYEAIPCGCVYCFVCIAEKIEAEEGEGWLCLRCGELVKTCKPWNGDVVEEVRRVSGSGKNVGFAIDTESKIETVTETDSGDELGENDSSRETETDNTLADSNTWSTIERDSTDTDAPDVGSLGEK